MSGRDLSAELFGSSSAPETAGRDFSQELFAPAQSMRIPPEVQARRDQDAVAIIEAERKKNLAAGNIELAAVNAREIARLQKNQPTAGRDLSAELFAPAKKAPAEERPSLGAPMGEDFGSAIMQAASEKPKAPVEPIAFGPRPEYVEEIRQSFSNIPEEKRRAALQELAKGTDFKAKAAQQILADVLREDQARKAENFGRERLIDLIAKAPKKPASGTGQGRVEFPDVAPTMGDILDQLPEKERIARRLSQDEAARGVYAADTSAAALRERAENERGALANIYRSFVDIGIPQAEAGMMGLNVVAQQAKIQETADKIKALEAQGRGDSAEARALQRVLSHYANRQETYFKNLAEKQIDLSGVPAYKGVRELSQAKSFEEGFKSFAKDPLNIIANISAASLPAMIPAFILGVVNPALGTAAMGGSSFGVEFGGSLLEFAGEKGFDLTNKEDVSRFFSDKALLREGVNKAGQRAGIVAAGDMLLAGLASKTLVPKRITGPIAKNVFNMSAQMGAQAVGGGGFEALAQVATEGKITKPGEVIAEMVGEFGTAPAEVYSQTRQAARDVRRARLEEAAAQEEQRAKTGIAPVGAPTQPTAQEEPKAAAQAGQAAPVSENQTLEGILASLRRLESVAGLAPAKPSTTGEIVGTETAQTQQAEAQGQEAPAPAAVGEQDLRSLIGPIEGPAKENGANEVISADEAGLLRSMIVDIVTKGLAAGETRQQIINRIDGLTKGGLRPSGYQRINDYLTDKGVAEERAPVGVSGQEPPPFIPAEEIVGEPAPVSEEVEKLTADQKALAKQLRPLEKRTAGTSLYKVLSNTLNDGEISELAGKARDAKKNPFIALKAPKGRRGSSMEDMADSGKLDLFLPPGMRRSDETFDSGEAAEYLREKLRNGDYFTYETKLAIDLADAEMQSIERQIQQLLTINDINKELQYAADEQRELDQAAEELAPAEEDRVAEPGAREEEGFLKPQTEAELAAREREREAAQKREKETRREEERRAAAPKPEEFVLTGSDRAADEAAARGQEDFFSIEPISRERATFREDIPYENWLAEKVEDAELGGRNQFGVPRRMGSVTGSFSRVLNLPTYLLGTLKGERGEQQNVREDSLKYIRENWDEVKNEPVYVEVDPFGQAWVSEGNHRIMVAREKGDPTLPVEIRYFSGGQRKAGPFAPDELLKLDRQQSPTFESVTPYKPVDTDSPSFKKWFSESVAVDESGNPERMYHSTYSDVKQFTTNFGEDEYRRFGAHVGSLEAAQSRLEIKAAEDAANRERSGNAGANVMPVYIRAERPLRLDENRAGRWGVDDIMRAIMDKAENGEIDAISQDDVDAYMNDEFDIDRWLGLAPEPGDANYDPDRAERVWSDQFDFKSGERSDLLKLFIKQLGYDSIVYKNEFEGGGDSYILLEPNQIKSAVSNVGTFEGPNILENIDALETVGQSVANDVRSPSLKRTIKTLSRRRDRGEITDQQFIEQVNDAIDADEEARFAGKVPGRTRGADYIRQRLLEAKRRGDLSTEAVDLAEWFIRQNEALVSDLGIAIKTPKQGGTGGFYNTMARIMVMMKRSGSDNTVIHEILHHLERMMPAEIRSAIRKEWMASLLKAQKKAKTPQQKLFFAALMNHHLGSGRAADIDMAEAGQIIKDLVNRGVIEDANISSYQLATEMLRNGLLPINNYQYASPSEFWAVNGSDIVRGRFNAIKGGLLARLKNWLRELGQKIKGVFGLRSEAPLIKALDSLAKSDGKFVTSEMLEQKGTDFLSVEPRRPSGPAVSQPQTGVKRMRDSWMVARDEVGRLSFGPGAKAYDTVARISNAVLDKVAMKPISNELSRSIRNMKAEVNKVQNQIVGVAKELEKLSPQEREMISDVIEGELKAGVHPPQHILNIAASMREIMNRQSEELVRLGMLSPKAAARWENKYLPRFYMNKLRDDIRAWAKAAKRLMSRQPMMRGIKGDGLKARGLFETIYTDQLQEWIDAGWEQRDPNFDPDKSETTVVWRDYTREERENMGEIRDAMFRFVMGYNSSQRDVALGRLYENLAENYSSKSPMEGYVQVPDTKVPGTMASRYGKLAGLYVPREIMDHLAHNDESVAEGVLKLYRSALSKWKEGKTVLNPVSHANNVLSNLTMAHFAGVSYWDGQKYVGAIKDIVTNDDMLQEAKDVGLFLGTFKQSELVESMPPQLRALANMTESQASKIGERLWDTLAFTVSYGGKKYGARPVMQWMYENEDLFFRYLIYRDARKRGMEPEDAREYSQQFIFTYDDLPKGARVVRDFGMPFFAYTYKVVPVIARTAMEYPWRFAAPATVAYAVNAAMYSVAAGMGGGDDDWWAKTLYKYVTDPEFRKKVKEFEEEERKKLPPWMKGRTALGTEKAIRLGMDEVTEAPLFLDMSRIFPGGDLFDAENNAGGVAILQPLMPSNPVLTSLVAMFANKDMFFGKEVVKATDTDAEKAQKRAAWMWKQWTPAISVGNYHFDRAANVMANVSQTPITVDAGPMGVVSYTGIGKDGLPVQPKYAAMQTMGIKVRPYDLEVSEAIEKSKQDQMIREIELEISRLNRLERKGAISEEAGEIERTKLKEKKQLLREGLTVEGKERK